MKSILISIQPRWCELIASGQKTVEVRKTRPKIDAPFKCYIYMSKGQRELLDVWEKGDEIWGGIYYEQDKPQFVKGGYKYEHTPYFQKVIGEFVCDGITMLKADNMIQAYFNNAHETCLSDTELRKYAADGKALYYWHISDLVIYDKPKDLSEFKKYNRECKYSDLGLAIPKCKDCPACNLTKPPQSWCYVEEINA